MQLRPYQQRYLDALRQHAAEGSRKMLLTLPTGGGKTVIASALVASARALGSGVLFIAHRLELIDQAVRQIGGHCGVIRADDERTDPSATVQVATIQTLARRKLPEADIVIVDEAHRVMADSYQRILSAYPEAIIIGLTATPCRLDGRALGDTFEKLVQLVSYSELIELGSIVAPVVYSTRVAPQLEGIHTRQGDYAIDELEVAMTDAQVVGSVVDEWKTHAEGRPTVVFACTIKHSQAIVDQFRAAGVRAEHLDGETPIPDRRAILARLDSGETEVVSNVGVLCEGWDQPSVKCLSIARPTKSLALWMQMAGRVLRPPGSPVIIDHGRNFDLHGPPHQDTTWDLLTGTKPKEKSKFRTCPKCFAFVQKNPCELCGHFVEPVAREVRVDAGAKLEKREGDPRVLFFDRMLEQARTKGFKPGFAGAKFKDQFGQWPPWSWSERAKRAFAEDEAWQRRQATREREREFWKSQDKKEEIVETVDETGAFDDLLR